MAALASSAAPQRARAYGCCAYHPVACRYAAPTIIAGQVRYGGPAVPVGPIFRKYRIGRASPLSTGKSPYLRLPKNRERTALLAARAPLAAPSLL